MFTHFYLNAIWMSNICDGFLLASFSLSQRVSNTTQFITVMLWETPKLTARVVTLQKR